MMNWSGLPKTITDYHRLPLTDWFYSIEHSNLSPGYLYICIPDSTNYKSTASGANNLSGHAGASKTIAFENHKPCIFQMISYTICFCKDIWMLFFGASQFEKQLVLLWINSYLDALELPKFFRFEAAISSSYLIHIPKAGWVIRAGDSQFILTRSCCKIIKG